MLRYPLFVVAGIALTTSTASAGGWGSIQGQFVLEDDVPADVPLVRPVPGARAFCALVSVPDDSRAFDPASKGIANIFVYLRRAPADIHPDLKSSSNKEIEFDQKGCRFLPHGLIVRTDQVVYCRSADLVAHNVHTHSVENTSTNFIVQPNDRKGIPVKMPGVESLPVKVQCDIHPWMGAWWLVVNHPYAAVTDKDGRFKIENLPEGEHEFRVWHERAGYIDRKYRVIVRSGEVTHLPVAKVPLTAFQQ